MTTIYLIRHAEAEGNLYRRIHGWYDALVTENGLRQISALRRRFQDIPVDAVYSSDLLRTMTTARALYEPRGLELHTDPDLRELNFGTWEDQPWGQVYHCEPERMGQFNRTDPEWRAPLGESLEEAGARAGAAVERIARAHPGQTVAIFSHGTAMRQLLADIKGLSPEEWHTQSHSENTGVTKLEWDGARFCVLFEGDASHLSPDMATLGRQAWWRKEGARREDVNLWYRPLNWPEEKELYLEARREAWRSTHGEEIPFDGEGFLQDAGLHLSRNPWGITVAMAGDKVAGLLQLDPERYQEDKAGYIPFCYLTPERRGMGLGIQLIGQAVAFYRPQGRDRLRLRCAPYNQRAQHFYAKHGFYKIGEEQGSRVPLDILEKYIGLDRVSPLP